MIALKIIGALYAEIFTMFYRGSVRSKGSGLGLYIANKAVEKMGGQLCFKSVVDLETTFYFAVPID